MKPRYTNRGKRMEDLEDPEYCPDSHSHNHDWETDLDENDNPVTTCTCCAVRES